MTRRNDRPPRKREFIIRNESQNSSIANQNRNTIPKRTRWSGNKNPRCSTFRCYNCSETGHTSRRCTKPMKRCKKCSHLRHDTQNCETLNNRTKVQSNGQSNIEKPKKIQIILQIIYTDEPNGKFSKSILLDGTQCSAYIDLISQCTLVRNSVAKSFNIIQDKTGRPIIKGFALVSFVPISKIVVTIRVDTVEADAIAYVVPDHLLNTDVLIGQSLPELPTVVIHKTSTDLTLYCDDTDVERFDFSQIVPRYICLPY